MSPFGMGGLARIRTAPIRGVSWPATSNFGSRRPGSVGRPRSRKRRNKRRREGRNGDRVRKCYKRYRLCREWRTSLRCRQYHRLRHRRHKNKLQGRSQPTITRCSCETLRNEIPRCTTVCAAETKAKQNRRLTQRTGLNQRETAAQNLLPVSCSLTTQQENAAIIS